MIIKLIVLLVSLYSLVGCGDRCSEYSDFTCDEIESSSYNVYFYYPNDKEHYLGVSNNLSQCGSMAHNHARSREFSRSDGWNYICCMKAKGSECYEKHR